MSDLLDVSVWLPLCVPDHVHHRRALRYWQEESAEELLFCRVSVLGLLRLLTNPRILGSRALDAASAWRALEAWLAVPEVKLIGDPPGLDELLRGWSATLDIRGGAWTDAYLAAVAVAGGCRLVAFDGDFHRYPGLAFLHLRPEAPA
jgi:toxin-antitoxin system PIN domain toxin